ncbi:MAG: FG-GAP repeat domain-containing protein [Solirubrobacterales bacterium]
MSCLPCRGANWDFREIVVDENPPQPDRVADIQIVDIDGDGRLDVWCGGARIALDEHKSAWYEQQDSAWVRHTPFPGPAFGGNWGDLDGDDDVDLIAAQDRNATKTGNHALVWLENPLANGGESATDTWTMHQIHRDPADPEELHTGFIDPNGRYVRPLDLNHDGRLDIVIASSQTLWYLPGPEDPNKGPWRFYKIAENAQTQGGAAIADLDGDKDLDIVWGRFWYENPGSPSVIPWRPHIIDPRWPNECKVAVGDLDKDGRLDVVLTGEASSHGMVWYANPVRDFRQPWTKHAILDGWQSLHSCQLADFDGDGDLDVLTAEMRGYGQQRVAIVESVDIRLNQWQAHILSTVGSHNAVVADLNNDGAPDIAGKNLEGDIRPRIWLNPNGKRGTSR